MIFWLDWKLFGNGHGMASPYCDDVFYWLSGNFYRWNGGLGAQLTSYEWFVPYPGTRRKLFGQEFVVFSARRRWIRAEISWTIAEKGFLGLVEQHSEIARLHLKLVGWKHGK